MIRAAAPIENFMAAFNERAYDRLTDYLTENVVYIDSTGAELRGRDDLVALVRWLTTVDPEFRHFPRHYAKHDEMVLITSEVVSGTFSKPSRVLCEAKTENGRIAYFRSFQEDQQAPIVSSYRRAANA